MRTIIQTLALAAAVAPPHHPGRSTTTTTPSHPKGFHLTAHVTDTTQDLTPPVEGWALGTIHTGAGLSAAVLSADPSTQGGGGGRLFYENGTAQHAADQQTTIVTDGGTPPFPFSLQLQAAGEPRRIAEISVGQVTAAAVVQGRLVNGLGAEGNVLACIAAVPYYNLAYVTLRFAYGKLGEVPEECVPIELVARCAALNELPEGSLSSHEFAAEVGCFP